MRGSVWIFQPIKQGIHSGFAEAVFGLMDGG
ncbi:Uncharacterised protein [Vibrio cholerae]|nr:Uncharacterised protein [Vibrio cholerae]